VSRAAIVIQFPRLAKAIARKRACHSDKSPGLRDTQQFQVGQQRAQFVMIRA